MAGFIHTKLLYEIPEAMKLVSSSRSVLYEEIRAGRLGSVKRGRSRLIPASAVDEYVALLTREAANGAGTDRDNTSKAHEAA